MFVPSLSPLKIHRDFEEFNRVVVGAQIIENVKSTKEYNDNLVLDDLSGIIYERCLCPFIHSLPGVVCYSQIR